MGDDRPSVYYEDTRLIIRASAIGSPCLWELAAIGQGYLPDPFPDWLLRAFDEGNEAEPIVLSQLQTEYGMQLRSSQEQGELVISPTLAIRYHPDGIVDWPWFAQDPFKYIPTLLEIKAMEDSGWRQAQRSGVGSTFAEYNWQLSVMMHALKTPAVWVVLNKGGAFDENTGDRADTIHKGELHIQHVIEPPIPLHVIVERAYMIQDLVAGEDLLISGRDCDSPNHFPCRFLHLRPEPDGTVTVTGTVLEVDDPELEEEVDYLAKEYVMLKGQADEMDMKLKKAKARLLEIGGDHKKIRTSKWEIPIIRSSNTSTDWASVPEAVKEELVKYKKSTPFEYIKKPKRLD